MCFSKHDRDVQCFRSLWTPEGNSQTVIAIISGLQSATVIGVSEITTFSSNYVIVYSHLTVGVIGIGSGCLDWWTAQGYPQTPKLFTKLIGIIPSTCG